MKTHLWPWAQCHCFVKSEGKKTLKHIFIKKLFDGHETNYVFSHLGAKCKAKSQH